MALEIFKLFGSIMVDNDKANDSISQTDKKAQGVGKTLLKGVGTTAKWGAGILAAAGAGVTALGAVAMKSAGVADNMSQKIGISRTAYQELDFVMSQSGAVLLLLGAVIFIIIMLKEMIRIGFKKNTRLTSKKGKNSY